MWVPIYYRAPGELPQIVLEPRGGHWSTWEWVPQGLQIFWAQVLRQLSAALVDVLVGGGAPLPDAETTLLGDNIHFAGTVPAPSACRSY